MNLIAKPVINSGYRLLVYVRSVPFDTLVTLTNITQFSSPETLTPIPRHLKGGWRGKDKRENQPGLECH
jgi:hypothetical protein